MIRKIVSAQFVKYVIVGGTGTGLDFCFLYILVEYLHLQYLIAAAISISIIFFGCFTANKYWTFEDKESGYFQQMFQYLLVHLVGLGLSLVILYSLVEYLGLWYIFAKVFATLAAFLWNFFIARYFIFQATADKITE